jgi:hypothetical protein
MPKLGELDARGLRYYFQYTILNNPRQIDPNVPSLERSIDTFKELANIIGKDRVNWRYDPIFFTNVTGSHFHRESFSSIATSLRGFTSRVVISIVDEYRKMLTKLRSLKELGIWPTSYSENELAETITEMVKTANRNGMEITSCAEEIDLIRYGVRPGKCIDDELFSKLFNIETRHEKDKSQRPACNCIPSKDIGMYNSCLFNCIYCYATSSIDRAKTRFTCHDKTSPRLIPHTNSE